MLESWYDVCTLDAVDLLVSNLFVLCSICIQLGEEYELWRSSFCKFLQLPVSFSLLGTRRLLYTLFQSTL